MYFINKEIHEFFAKLNCKKKLETKFLQIKMTPHNASNDE